MSGKAGRLRELRVRRDVNDIIGLGNVARYDDVIVPRQLDEIVVKPSNLARYGLGSMSKRFGGRQRVYRDRFVGGYNRQ